MPLLESSYAPKGWLKNPHWNTLKASQFRRAPAQEVQRVALDLPDGDRIWADWTRSGHRRCAVVLHGLGGSSRRTYVRGMARRLEAQGWDVLALNMRGCGGTMNPRPVTYHSGRTEDPLAAAEFLKAQGFYEDLALVGFSLGGNVAVKLAGETGTTCPFSKIAAVSAPLDLASSAGKLRRSRYYTSYLIGKLKKYLVEKQAQFPDLIDLTGFSKLRGFKEYDDRYTAPLNGFSSAEDYWEKCSGIRFLEGVRRPLLILSAQDDPILTPSCFPADKAQVSPYIHLLAPKYGGHVGFLQTGREFTYAEDQTAQFFS